MSLADRVRIRDTRVLSDDWYVLRKTVLDYRRRDGSWQTLSRETYDRGNGAVILLYDRERRTVVLTRQFRFPAFVNGCDELLIEAPAGLLEDAAPEQRIRAEAEEETGYRVEAPTRILDLFMSPGSVTERIHFFTAPYSPPDRVAGGGGNAAEGEDIEVLEPTIDEALSMIRSGRIRDAKTVILLQHAALEIFTAPAAALI